MKIAIVLTVKNEERLLRKNLLYHKAIGISKAFVYFDNTTDKGKQSIIDLDFVESQNSVDEIIYSQVPYLEKFTSQAKEHHTARQCLNTYDALLKCKQSGIDWLISLDADELICTSLQEPSDLKDFFNKIDATVDVVNFQTREALQQKVTYNNVFKDETLFKTTYVYKKRFQKLQKLMYNPFTKKQQAFSYWYGQHLGKGAIRVNKEIIPHNVHRYKHKDNEKLNKITKGYILHYHAFDAEDFIKKFTNFSDHPNTFLSGNKIENIKLLLRDIVNTANLTKKELILYFEKNLMFSKSEVKKLKQNTYLGIFKRKIAPLQTITSVQKVFNTKIKPSEN